jgi:membrane protease YdiL (CAAX protease family)
LNTRRVPDLAQDRRALALFAALTVVFCTAAYIPMLTGGGLGALGGFALIGLMWSPGVAGVLTSLVIYRSLGPVGLLGNRRAPFLIAACIAIPIAYGLLIKLGLASTGWIGLAPELLPRTLLLIGLFVSLKTALGEELGWRGLAAPVLERLFGFVPGQLALGLIWFLYHLPLLLTSDYGKSAHPLFGNAMFLVAVIGMSLFLGWVRRQSGSVWPCALLHASHNLVFLHLFDPLVPVDAAAGWLVGEQGVLFACAQVLLGLWVLRAAGRS